MKVLVTGGCGFIGSNFIRYILNNHRDWEVVNLDALTYAGNPENLADLRNEPRYSFIHGRIENALDVKKAIEGCDVVVNFAAETHVDRSIENSHPFVKTNVLGTQVLLDVAQRVGIKKFIHISTDEVYGCLGEKESPFTESAPLNPRSPYAASKASADLLALAWYHTYKLPIIIVRPSNNYGPYQFPEKLIPLAITNIMEGKKVPVYGLGENIRDWIYVEDTCRAIEVVLNKGLPNEIYNIGCNCERRNIDLVTQILQLMGRDSRSIEFVDDRPGHDYRYALNTEKIKSLGWYPEIDLSTGLRKTIEWYLKNPHWWQPLKKKLIRESLGFWSKKIQV